MSSISFKLEGFEGPLDLLLHLVSKHKMDINNIPIMLLVEQYLDYISGLTEQDMETAGEFLEMAARLIYIKTVSLLPRKEEAEELKKELEGRLIEYSLCKLAAEKMRDIYIGDSFAVRAPMKIEVSAVYDRSHSPEELVKAYEGMSKKEKKKQEELAPSVFSKLVSRKFVSVTSKIVSILKQLYKFGSCSMEGLFSDMTDRSERVAAFLAVLELTKSGRIILSDDNSEITFNKSANNESLDDIGSEWEEKENEADG